MTSGLQLSAYSLWQYAALARRALRQGSTPALAEAFHAIEQIRDHSRRDSLTRCCESTLATLRRDALLLYGRVPAVPTQPVTRFP